MKYSEYYSNIVNIIKSYVGKNNKQAYDNIAKDLEKYTKTVCSDTNRWNFSTGSIVYDTMDYNGKFIENVNIGTMSIIEYTIIWKPDGRSADKRTNWILDIKVSNKLPHEFLNIELEEISHRCNYLLARKKYKSWKNEKKRMEKALMQIEEGIARWKKIMIEECYDEKKLDNDLK